MVGVEDLDHERIVRGLELGLELEHVAEVVGAGKAERGVLVAAAWALGEVAAHALRVEHLPRRRRSRWAYAAIAMVLVALGVVAYQALTGSPALDPEE